MTRYVVSIHELGQAYGGPEEGGWWWDCGYPARESSLRRWTRVFRSRAKAIRYARRLNEGVVREASRGARPLTSVLYAGGQYAAVFQTGTSPRPCRIALTVTNNPRTDPCAPTPNP